jgi:hypothetical protein
LQIFAAPSNRLWKGSVPRRIGSKADTEQLGKFERAVFFWWRIGGTSSKGARSVDFG